MKIDSVFRIVCAVIWREIFEGGEGNGIETNIIDLFSFAPADSIKSLY